MRILVLGASGQIARALYAAGGRDNLAVATRGRPQTDVTQAAAVDLTIAETHPDVIVNAAAFTAVDDAEANPKEAYAVNRDGAGLVAQAAAARGVALIHLSTDYVFDGTKQALYEEADPARPCNVYGLSKLAGEEVVRANHPKAIVLRTAWLHSERGRNFPLTILTRARSGGEISVVDDQWGCPTFADDAASGIVAIARDLMQNGPRVEDGLLHMASPDSTSRLEWAREILSLSKSLGGPFASIKPVKTAAFASQTKRPLNSRLSSERLRRIYGISLPSWRDGLTRCMSRVAENGWSLT